MDRQHFEARCSREVSDNQRGQFTGWVEFRIQFANGRYQRGTIQDSECTVWKRESRDAEIRSVPQMMRQLEAMKRSKSSKFTGWISLRLSFFAGSVVDIQTNTFETLGIVQQD